MRHAIGHLGNKRERGSRQMSGCRVEGVGIQVIACLLTEERMV
jgi:hypothetical protein